MQEDIYNRTDIADDKDQKIETLISELESIPYEGIKEEAFDYSNDEDVAKLIPQIAQLSNNILGEIRSVIIVGSGPLWNIPKELNNIDLIISLDVNKNQLERNKSRIQEILSTKNPQSLLPIPNNDINQDDIVAVAKERRRLKLPQIEMSSYGNYHYLSSEETLQKTQDYLKQAKIAYVCGDISDREFTAKFGNILKNSGGNIVFADFSNISEWVCGSKLNQAKKETFINTLTLIPIDKTCPILHSRSAGRVGRSPIYSQLSVGITSYEKDLI